MSPPPSLPPANPTKPGGVPLRSTPSKCVQPKVPTGKTRSTFDAPPPPFLPFPEVTVASAPNPGPGPLTMSVPHDTQPIAFGAMRRPF